MNTIAVRVDLVKYCAIKYPGKNDISNAYNSGKSGQPQERETHKELVRMWHTCVASKARLGSSGRGR